MKKVYLITHPDVIIDPAVPIPQWPLSPLGKQRMQKLLLQPWVHSVGSIYSSTEQKAVDGAEILAHDLSLAPTQMLELGEIDRSSTGYLPYSEHMAIVDQFFAHPTKASRAGRAPPMPNSASSAPSKPSSTPTRRKRISQSSRMAVWLPSTCATSSPRPITQQAAQPGKNRWLLLLLRSQVESTRPRMEADRFGDVTICTTCQAERIIGGKQNSGSFASGTMKEANPTDLLSAL